MVGWYLHFVVDDDNYGFVRTVAERWKVCGRLFSQLSSGGHSPGIRRCLASSAVQTQAPKQKQFTT